MRRRTAYERACGGEGVLPAPELRDFRVWCRNRGYQGWEHHGDADLEQGSVFQDWCEERRQWAQVNGGWPGDPSDTGEADVASTTGIVRFSEELEQVISGAIPAMPWSECQKYI